MREQIIDMCQNTMDRFEFNDFESKAKAKANFTCKYKVKDKIYKEYFVELNNKIYDVRLVMTEKETDYIINER